MGGSGRAGRWSSSTAVSTAVSAAVSAAGDGKGADGGGVAR
jgi:hypothetical protein